jgi:hypothetical protein
MIVCGIADCVVCSKSWIQVYLFSKPFKFPITIRYNMQHDTGIDILRADNYMASHWVATFFRCAAEAPSIRRQYRKKSPSNYLTRHAWIKQLLLKAEFCLMFLVTSKYIIYKVKRAAPSRKIDDHLTNPLRVANSYHLNTTERRTAGSNCRIPIPDGYIHSF